ncbi:nuclear transport factor 2 family protein [Ferruginibacter sp.]|nr:nuclear transport factor 2 family protein [Ferruginibacter sp.]
MDTSENTKKVVLQFCQSLANRDLSLIDFFAENVDWYIQGNEKIAPWLGRRSKREEVKEFFQILWTNTESISAQIDHILVEDGFAVITGDFSTKMLQTDKVMKSIFSIHINVQNNLITKYRLLEDSYAVVIALTV